MTVFLIHCWLIHQTQWTWFHIIVVGNTVTIVASTLSGSEICPNIMVQKTYPCTRQASWPNPCPTGLVAWRVKLRTGKTGAKNRTVYCLQSSQQDYYSRAPMALFWSDAGWRRCPFVVECVTGCPTDSICRWTFYENDTMEPHPLGAVSKCVGEDRHHTATHCNTRHCTNQRSHWEWDHSGLAINKVGG